MYTLHGFITMLVLELFVVRLWVLTTHHEYLLGLYKVLATVKYDPCATKKR